MRFLILGNGFDKMHGLPTGYGDFIDFVMELFTDNPLKVFPLMKAHIKSEKERCNHIIEKIQKGLSNEIITGSMRLITEVGVEEVFVFCMTMMDIKKSFWINHFVNNSKKIDKRWMDFEKEIEHVIKEIFNSDYEERELVYSDISNKEVADYFIGNKTIYSKDFEEMFYNEFRNFNDLIKHYMHLVNYLPINKLDRFHSDYNDYVLTFNYTDTYERLYSSRNICHIHGDINDIVLGFNDYYRRETINPRHIKYEKYYQRIVNKTDNIYFNWLEQAANEKEVRVEILGHSLSPEDGDILRKFILLENADVVIYYKDENDRAEKIENLAIILNPEKLIELTNGINARITFVQLEQTYDFRKIIRA